MTRRNFSNEPTRDVTSYRDGMTFDEIGRRLGVSRQEAKRRFDEAMVKLIAVADEIRRIEACKT